MDFFQSVEKITKEKGDFQNSLEELIKSIPLKKEEQTGTIIFGKENRSVEKLLNPVSTSLNSINNESKEFTRDLLEKEEAFQLEGIVSKRFMRGLLLEYKEQNNKLLRSINNLNSRYLKTKKEMFPLFEDLFTNSSVLNKTLDLLEDQCILAIETSKRIEIAEKNIKEGEKNFEKKLTEQKNWEKQIQRQIQNQKQEQIELDKKEEKLVQDFEQSLK
ncbi:hypothetical protein M0813_10515 [Anaeramoeba flamelloides]|uniref:Biogenesis of lysosome-related organelles complex 1 subunit 5 n=1 Tax=Anaeramoeba flamelloides TaxID=1746091 RepID=A0AAV7ZM22_9EUKA|nr:hypothetical protein M0812_11876 [Anaeramoeba flamelloides]KAJ6226977.1 hypothetical protein M0813_10515 [Anaeramoeba flamelloides]